MSAAQHLPANDPEALLAAGIPPPVVREPGLPDYALMMAAYHRAYAETLHAMLDALPWRPGDQVLDLACGDGVYTRWLADRLGPRGLVIGLDLSPRFLNVARSQFEPARFNRPDAATIAFCRGDVYRLPFADDTFDLVWCAQSLYSLPNTRGCLEEMVRVTRPQGVVAILENDTLHHILLPWPIELELQVRAAELQALEAASESARRFYVGRGLSRILRVVGLEDVADRVWATNRQPPFSPAEQTFFTEYLATLRDRVRPFLPPRTLDCLDQLIAPTGSDFLLEQPDISLTCLDRLVWGCKPRPLP